MGVFVTSFAARFTGHRADVIIIDDPHDIGDGIEEIEKTIEVFNTKLLSRLNDRKNGRVLVVGHRVHERDLSASLLQEAKWKHVALPLVAPRDRTYKTTSVKWRQRAGEILRPSTWDRELIEKLRRKSFNPGFEMLYQQDVDFQALPAIRPEHFSTFTHPAASFGPVVLSVDAGMRDGGRNAFSVVQAWSLIHERFYLLDQFRQQCDYRDLRDNVRRFRKIYHPVAILVERAANGCALISDLREKHAGLLMPIEPDGRSKSARFCVHAETIISKRIWLPADAWWRDDFIAELVEFPHGKFSDQVDAMTQFLDHADKFAGLEPSPRAGIAQKVNRFGQCQGVSFIKWPGARRHSGGGWQ